MGHAEAAIVRACDMIQDRYGFYTVGWSAQASTLSDERLRADLATVVAVALAHQDGVEGGIWQTVSGSLAYAYPTYEGSGPKLDLPAAERDEIQAANERAARDEQPVEHRTSSKTQTLLLHACPLRGPIAGLTGWTMTRVQSAPGLRQLQLGFGVLLALMLAMSALLWRTLSVWGRHVRSIETALAKSAPGGTLSAPRTGERELDRIIDALNDAGERLAKARAESDEMGIRVARAERLAGLGRVAAGIAHEIRNPIAAARLQGENALAGDDRRRSQAIIDMLGQIARLDAHVAELLAMTQRAEPHVVRIDLAAFLADRVAPLQDIASAKGVTIAVRGAEGSVCLDPAIIGRVLDNLIINAVRHVLPGGAVTLAAERDPELVTLTVEDSGPGVAPEMQDRLFEPFATGRADGTGLGLAIARELADAHGGRLVLRPPTAGSGAVFALTVPQEGACAES